MTSILNRGSFKCRVSTVLNRDVKIYGQQCLFDDSEETCWNSESGTPQWILINLKSPEKLSTLEIQFQGGFAGKDCHLEAGDDPKNLNIIQNFYPEDTNTTQIFKLDETIEAKCFRIVFDTSTDFFGRIVIYKLSLYS